IPATRAASSTLSWTHRAHFVKFGFDALRDSSVATPTPIASTVLITSPDLHRRALRGFPAGCSADHVAHDSHTRALPSWNHVEPVCAGSVENPPAPDLELRPAMGAAGTLLRSLRRDLQFRPCQWIDRCAG